MLLVGHVQGFIEDLSDLLIDRLIFNSVPASKLPDRFRFSNLKHEIEELKQQPDPDKTVKKLRHIYTNQYAILDNQRNIDQYAVSEQYKDGFGNPNHREIKKHMNKFGFIEFEGWMKARLKAQYLVTENALNFMVDKRVKIAHGDHQATLTTKELNDYSKLVRKYCASADMVTCRYFRRLGCTF